MYPSFRSLFTGLACLVGGFSGPMLAQNNPGALSGEKLQTALEQPLFASWKNTEFREALTKLGQQRRVTVILDRRIDPNRIFSFTATGQSLREGLRDLAEQARAECVFTSHCVYLGPPMACARLQVILDMKSREIDKLTSRWRAREKLSTWGTKPVHWEDLAEPRAVLESLAEVRGLTLTGLDRLPHDLWARAEFPPLPTTEALSLILVQFDLSFTLQTDGKTLEIVPISDDLIVSRCWAASNRLEQQLGQFAELKKQRNGPEVEVRGTWKQLTELTTKLGPLAQRYRPPLPPPVPLSQRRITLTAENVPLSAILEQLADSGIRLEYDREQFTQAGIDLNQTVSVSVQQARIEEFLDTILEKVPITPRVEGEMIHLSPKK